MQHFLAPFRWFDALVQHSVDAIAFWMMRRGIRKSLQTYAVHALLVISAVGVITYRLQKGDSGMAAFIGFLTVFASIWMHIRLKQDTVDEDKGFTYTRNDRDDHGKSGWKIFWYAMLILDFVIAVDTGFDFNRFCDLSFDISFLLILYLAQTPNTPPPSEETVHEPVKHSA